MRAWHDACCLQAAGQPRADAGTEISRTDLPLSRSTTMNRRYENPGDGRSNERGGQAGWRDEGARMRERESGDYGQQDHGDRHSSGRAGWDDEFQRGRGGQHYGGQQGYGRPGGGMRGDEGRRDFGGGREGGPSRWQGFGEYESEGELSRMGGSQQMLPPTQGGGRYSSGGYGSQQREFGTSYGQASGYEGGRRGMSSEHGGGLEGSWLGSDRADFAGDGPRSGRGYGGESAAPYGSDRGQDYGSQAYGSQWSGSQGYASQGQGGGWRNQGYGGRQGYGGGQDFGGGGMGGAQRRGSEFGRSGGDYGAGGGGAYGSGMPGEHAGQNYERGGWSGSGPGGQQYGLGADHRGRGPKGYTRSDDRLREDICERLTDDPHIDASDIQVEVDKGVVSLSGNVGDRWMKYHVEDVVDRCAGVKDIRNQLGTHRSSSGRSSTGENAGSREQDNEFGSHAGSGSRKKN
jgi:hypothetical protein